MREAGICTETTKQELVINHHYSTLWPVNNYHTIMCRPHIKTGLSALSCKLQPLSQTNQHLRWSARHERGHLNYQSNISYFFQRRNTDLPDCIYERKKRFNCQLSVCLLHINHHAIHCGRHKICSHPFSPMTTCLLASLSDTMYERAVTASFTTRLSLECNKAHMVRTPPSSTNWS